MKYTEYKGCLKKDRKKYSSKGHLYTYFVSDCYRLIVHYRRCKLFQSHLLFRGLYYIERYIYHKMCVKCGCSIPSHAEIGAGFEINHSFGVVINSKAVIGENFTIKSGAVIGNAKSGGAAPVIGNNVTVGANAIVIGAIHLGDGATIGAGAIVTNDVPKGAVMIGEKAHIHRINAL